VNSLLITTPEESTKCKERKLLGGKDRFGLEEKRAAENLHHLDFGSSGAPYPSGENRYIEVPMYPRVRGIAL
jgi:hypothetical protein